MMGKSTWHQWSAPWWFSSGSFVISLSGWWCSRRWLVVVVSWWCGQLLPGFYFTQSIQMNMPALLLQTLLF